MTCIVGVKTVDSVIIGADSIGANTSTYEVQIRQDPKVFKNGKMVCGFTDSFRMGQLLRYSFEPPEFYPGSDPYAYLVTRFVDALRECFKQGGYATKKDEEESGGTFVVGMIFDGAPLLFEVHTDYQIHIPKHGYLAVGCGASYAIGALNVFSRTHTYSYLERVHFALGAAEEHSAYVRRPFIIEEIKVSE